MNIISVFTRAGCVGRCGTRCYSASESGCTCICAGENHGAGKERAVDNTREKAEVWIERARENGQDVIRVKLALDVMQEPLFGRADLEATI
jgi:hypothetical protein